MISNFTKFTLSPEILSKLNKSYLNFRTDMADERVDTYKKVHNLSEIEGIKVESKINGKISTTIVDVLNDNGKKAVSKEIGKYITIETGDIELGDERIYNYIKKSNIS